MRLVKNLTRRAQLLSVAAVVAWVTAVTLLLVNLFGLDHASGWVLACSLGYSSLTGLALIVHELNRPVNFPSRESLTRCDVAQLHAHWAAASSPP